MNTAISLPFLTSSFIPHFHRNQSLATPSLTDFGSIRGPTGKKPFHLLVWALAAPKDSFSSHACVNFKSFLVFQVLGFLRVYFGVFLMLGDFGLIGEFGSVSGSTRGQCK